MARSRIGLTGGIASGKSTVAAMLAELGAVVIDADVLAREVVEPGTPALDHIVDRFGERVLADGQLDRTALGRIVFDDPQARADLEAIIHPAVRRRAAEQESAAGPDAIVVQMIPLLVETGQADDFDSVWVVDAPEDTQIDRLVRRDQMATPEAQRRIAAQTGRSDRLAAADVVIDNSDSAAGDDSGLRGQVVRAYRQLTRPPS